MNKHFSTYYMYTYFIGLFFWLNDLKYKNLGEHFSSYDDDFNGKILRSSGWIRIKDPICGQ